MASEISVTRGDVYYLSHLLDLICIIIIIRESCGWNVGDRVKDVGPSEGN